MASGSAEEPRTNRGESPRGFPAHEGEKVDDSNRGDFEQQGCGPFKPYPDKPASLSYYEVPVDVLEDPAVLAEWAGTSFGVAQRLKRGSK